MKLVVLFCGLLLLSTQLVVGQTAEPVDSARPDPSKMRNLCLCVSNRPVDGSGKYKWLYRKRIYEAAGVNDYDSKEVIIRKIQKVWRETEPTLLCTGAQFDVTKGNIVKWAVSYKFYDFINDIIKWGINLNRVDEADGRTALDYALFHIQRNKGNAMEPVYQDIYDTLRKAGAKHRRELSNQ
jgi:hypothetical protein